MAERKVESRQLIADSSLARSEHAPHLAGVGLRVVSGISRRRARVGEERGRPARINLFGYAVVEINFVRPLDRPRKGWFWQFALRPGF